MNDQVPSNKLQLSPEQMELFEFFLQEEGLIDQQREGITRGRHAEDIPLSFAQQRLWFLDQLQPGNAFYTIASAVRLAGALDITALLRCLNEIVRRHESLRTTFTTREDGTPVQVIAAGLTLPLPVLDLRAFPEAGRAAEALRLATEEARRPFDLAQGPLVRATLLHLDAEEYVLVLAMHHIISDGWSIGICIHELVTLYAAFTSGRPSPLPELPIQYADYAVWQRHMLQRGELRAQLDYWKQQLASAPAALELPADFPRPNVQTFRGATHTFTLPASLVAGLAALSRAANCTLFMTVLAAWQTLLHRLSNQNDIVVGTPIANRTRLETEGVIGCFINMLALRSDLSDDPSFRALLERVSKLTLAAFANQALPFDLLVDELEVQRDLSRTPLFQVAFAFQNAPQPALELNDLTLSLMNIESGTAKFDMLLNLTESANGLEGALEYSTDLFEDATIRRWSAYFQTLLEGIVEAPQRRLSQLPLLSAAEHDHILWHWNATGRSYPARACLHQLFEAQAQRNPHAVALRFGRQQLSYRALDRRANLLAHQLRSRGVGPDSLVAICAERSLELLVGLLGILKAGGAYVPLDPSYPKERLAFMLSDSRAALVLAQPHLAERLPETQAPLVRLESEWGGQEQLPAGPPPCALTPQHLAYLIYTSGSTGQPKGAGIPHQGILNRLLWMQDEYRLGADDRVLQKTPFSFDVSVWEFFWPLLVGARLVVARPEGHKDSAYLVEIINREQITTMHFVPPMLRVFLDEPDASSCRSLRRVICSGEALSYELQERFFARLGQAELHNLYGPTEASVDVSAWACRRGDPRQSVPIGLPVANTQLHILDRHGCPVPIGVPGELHIGGVQLARGYLGHPDLTAERFVPNPFSTTDDRRPTTDEAEDRGWRMEDGSLDVSEKRSSIFDPPSSSEVGGQWSVVGGRLYKTGDLARYRPDGAIEYLGRIDQQVKIRGFRIELGEIESMLLLHPAVRAAAVLAREDATPASGYPERRLVAYIVPAPELRTKNQEPDALAQSSRFSVLGSGEGSQSGTPSVVLGSEGVRQFLRDRLPDYMVPVAFVLLNALPLSPSGKVDRRALPAPRLARSAIEQAFVAPRTAAEHVLAQIWASVLGLDRVGVYDNFFELGGDSLRSIQVRTRARQAGLHFSLQQLYLHQTIEGLAHHLSAGEHDLHASPAGTPFGLITAEDQQKLPSDIEDAYPLTMMQQVGVFHSQHSPNYAVFTITAHLHGRFDAESFRAAAQELAGRHVVLRTAFDLTNFSEPLQLVYRTATIPVEVEDLRQLAPDQQETAVLAWLEREKRRRFDWARPPLLRFHIHLRSESTFQFTVSHPGNLLDGWSTASLNTELFGAYMARLNGQVRSLPAPPAALYRDFVALEQAALHSEEVRRYWEHELSASTRAMLGRWPAAPRAVKELPFRVSYPIAQPVLEGLLQAGQMAEAPLKSVLLAAHVRVMGLLGGQPDVLTGLLVNGRPETEDGERVLGIFTNTVAFRMRLSGGSWVELVRKTFQHELEVLPFRRYPLAEVQRHHGGRPLFETLFNFVHFRVYDSIRQEVAFAGSSPVYDQTFFPLAAFFDWDAVAARLTLHLDVDTIDLGDAQIEAITGYYLRALAAIAADPEARYEAQSLLAPQERRQVLEEWPAANGQMYVLDQHRQPAPIGVPGTLYAGNTDPAQNGRHLPAPIDSTVFGSHPRGSSPAEHLQPTGKFGRYLPDGTLEILGQFDQDGQPASAADASLAAPDYLAPRTPLEAVLAAVWADVLSLERVGIHDNFFQLGGHSLLAMQVIARIHEVLPPDAAHAIELEGLLISSLFEQPTIAALAQTIEQHHRLEHNLPPVPLRPVNHDQPLPLSFGQERLWFLQQLQPDSPFYNIPAVVRITGRLDPTALHHSLNTLVERHAVLRTTFVLLGGQPMQLIAPALSLALPLFDLQHTAPEERETQMRRQVLEEAQRPFDLAAGPLIRTTLLRLDEQEHILLLLLHHSIADGWSIGVVIRELSACYAARVAQQPLSLPALPLQYADYAVWQRQWLQGDVLAKHLEYWQNHLAGAPAELDLPTDYARPAVQSFRGARQTHILGPELTTALKAVSRREGVTPFMTLLTAFSTVLARNSGQDDLVIGTPVANRSRADLEGLIGFFVNTLALRIRLNDNPSLRELLHQVRQVMLGAYTHQDLPFEKLVEALLPERNLRRTPLFQVFINMQNMPMPAVQVDQLHITWLPVDNQSAKFDLNLEMQETSAGIDCAMEYCTDLFEAATISRLLKQFERVLRAMTFELEQGVQAVPLLSAAEQQQLLHDWNATGCAWPAPATLPALFAVQLARTPDAPALIDGSERLTYRELERRANHLAHYLRGLGVGPERRVAVCMQRSFEQVVALLAILKAGGAYVPLDPAAPAQRWSSILLDALVTAVVTQPHLREQVAALAVPVVVLEELEAAPLGAVATAPLPESEPAQAAYVLYTSGSTGVPKGVVGTHQATVNRLHWQWQTYPYAADEVCCHKTTLSFVDAVAEIWAPLLMGVPAVLVPEATVLDVAALVALLAEQQVTRLVVVPALLRLLLHSELDLQQALPALKLVTIYDDDDQLTVKDAQSAQERLPHATLVYHHGSVEVMSAIANDTWQSTSHSSNILIGRPIANSVAYVLDAQLQPVPCGVVGELYVAGLGLAQGYWQQPALTAAHFIPHPFSSAPGQRLYQTGERARYRADRTLEILGQFDQDGQPASAADASLAVPDYLAPRTPLEAVLAAVWAEVLSLERVGIHDNFFQLGGHSLLAMQVIARIHEVLPLDASQAIELEGLLISSLFEQPTIAALAETIEQHHWHEHDGQAVPLTPVDHDQPLPLSFGQERLWFLQQLQPDSPFYNIPVVVRITGRLEVAALEHSLNTLVERHAVLRTTFVLLDGQPMQLITPALSLVLPLSDLQQHAPEQREALLHQLVLEEAQRPFNLASGPLLRVRLFQLAAEEYVLLLLLHHSIADGWSIGVVIRELSACYAARVAQQPLSLPSLPLQYADYAVWQRQWLQGDVLAKHLEYWQNHLADAPAELDLPTDYARPAVQSFRGARQTRILGVELTAAITAVSRREGVTPFMMLLTAFSTVLARNSGQDDLVIGTPVANRSRADLEGLIGFFVNTLALRIRLNDNPSLRELLHQVRQVMLGAYTHQDLPFEKLVEALLPERNLRRTPLFQVMINMQNMPMPAVQLEQVMLTWLPIDNQSAKFELNLEMQETSAGIDCAMEYCTDLFEAATISRLLKQFERVLLAMTFELEQGVQAVPLLSAAEQQQLLHDWNATGCAWPEPATLPALFAAQLARTPDAPALIAGSQRLTYRELEHRANRLAHYLIRLGVGPERRVAVCMQRSFEQVVALLAILKAGGAYVPLDPAAPAQRWAHMLLDALVTAVITQPHLREQLAPHAVPIVLLSEVEAAPPGEVTSTPLPESEPAQAAYVLYTSGSTGVPKGVVGTHQATVNRLRWQWQTYPYGADEVCCHKTTLSFVDAVAEIWAPLLMGVPAVLVPEATVLDVAAFVALLEAQRVTRLVLVPSLLKVLLETSSELEHKLARLRLCVTSGEALPVELWRRFQEQLPQCRLLNLYGSSEVAADVSWHELAPEDARAARVPIGRPLANSALYVLDGQLQPVPIGVTGELYVAGLGLARGYWQQPALTAERFIPNPFEMEDGGWRMEDSHPEASEMRSSSPENSVLKIEDTSVDADHERSSIFYPPSSSRLYRTGDLARYRADGELEWLGRRDQQVKVRGVRVEVGELEALLLEHVAVRQALVLARPGPNGETQLVAYVVPCEVSSLGEAEEGGQLRRELRAFLRSRLPEAMLPAAVVLLEGLPLTPSGKLDRLALPALTPERFETEAGYVAPRTVVEEALAGIWAEVLGIERVGVYDSFFDLGGHSLLATSLLARVSDTFRVALPLQSFFSAATVAELSRVLIANEPRLGQTEKIARVLKQIEGLSPEEFTQTLGQKRAERVLQDG